MIQASSGMMMTSGLDGDPPIRVGMSIADSVAPLFAVMGINAALHRRDRTGDGDYVDISMLGSLTAMLATENWQAMQQLGAPGRSGNFNQRSTPMGVFECSDGYITIGAGTQDAFSHTLYRMMGRPEMVDDPRYATMAGRTKNHVELNRIVNEWSRQHTGDDIERQLVEAGIPVAKVRSPVEALDDPLLAERREISGVSHPDVGVVPGLKTVGLPTRFHRAEYGHAAPAPKLGEHNENIYGDWLGFDSEQLAAWKAAGVF